jgi:aspartate carbamoyltransferase catalytic subunit
MTDLLTIKRELGTLNNLTIGLVGDLKYGRTVHSLIKAMTRYENTKFVLISPPELALPDYIQRDVFDRLGVEYRESNDIESVIGDVDILYMTRVQQERFTDLDEYERVKDCFVLDAAKMRLAKERMAVLHPLPRVNEIAIDVDADPRAAYFRQVENGKFVRMALILKLLQWQKEVDKHFVQHGVAMDCQCPNPLCISNLEPVRKRFENVDGVVRCVYCESSCDKA